MPTDVLDSALRFVARGGPIMPPLLLLGLSLWILIVLRTLTLSRATPLVSDRTDPWEARLQRLDAASELRVFRRGIRAIVRVSPLLGLLGTVVGMVQTFQALGGVHHADLSGGISQSLISTQMGLGVAIPGLLMSRVLDQWERRLTRSL